MLTLLGFNNSSISSWGKRVSQFSNHSVSCEELIDSLKAAIASDDNSASACVNAPDQGVDKIDGNTGGGESGSCKVPEPSSLWALVSLFVLGILSSSLKKIN